MNVKQETLIETDLYISNKLRSTTDDLVLGSITGQVVIDDGQTLVGNIDATSIQGRPISNEQPLIGQFLGWNGNQWVATSTPASSFANQITVAKQGGHFSTIEAAISAAVSLIPSQDKPVLIRIYPGTYVENNTPLNIPSWVSIEGVSTQSVFIKPSNSNTNLFKMYSFSSLKNCTLRDCQTAVDVSNTSLVTSAIVDGCRIINANIGCHVQSDNTLVCRATTFETPSLNDTINVCIKNEGITICYNVDVMSYGVGTIVQGILHEGIMIDIDDASFTGCTNEAIYVDSSYPLATLSMNIIHIRDSGVGIYVNNGIVQMTSAVVSLCVVHIHAAENAVFVYNSAIFDMNAVNIHNNALFYGNGVTDSVVERRNRLIGNVDIGEVNQYSTLAVGSGGTYTRGMVVQSNSNGEAGTWVDHTANARHPLGGVYDAFPNNQQNNCIYFGSDQKFVGIVQLVFAGMVGGNVVFEYWNGSAWQRFNVFATLQDEPHTIFRNNVFTRSLSIENVRFNTAILPSWSTRTLNGHNKYWARARVTSNLTFIPQFGHIRIRASSTMIGNDGFIEYFGLAQPLRALPIHKRVFNDAAGDVPDFADVPITPNIIMSGRNNRFNANHNHSIIGMIHIPDNVNTSEAMTVTVKWFREGTGGTAIGTPAIRLRATYTILNDGTVIDGNLPDASITVDIDTLPNAKEQQKTIFKIPLAGIETDGILVLKLERRGTEDTYSGNAPDGSIIVNSVKCEAKVWSQ